MGLGLLVLLILIVVYTVVVCMRKRRVTESKVDFMSEETGEVISVSLLQDPVNFQKYIDKTMAQSPEKRQAKLELSEEFKETLQQYIRDMQSVDQSRGYQGAGKSLQGSGCGCSASKSYLKVEDRRQDRGSLEGRGSLRNSTQSYESLEIE